MPTQTFLTRVQIRLAQELAKIEHNPQYLDIDRWIALLDALRLTHDVE